MTLPFACLLPHRSVVRVGGPDRSSFLQGLISNDITKATDRTAIYAALLTPQGKFLHDMFILAEGDSFLIDCEVARIDDLLHRLTAYKLRAKVSFEIMTSAFDVWAVWDGDYQAPLCFSDPRLVELGYRLFSPKGKEPANTVCTEFASFDQHRLRLGVADGSRDMEIGRSTLAEGNFDMLNGVDWKKGCYVGQELTARMHYRGLSKKRLFPVRVEGGLVPHGTLLPNDAGEMRSQSGTQGLALLRMDSVEQAMGQEHPITLGETRIWSTLPLWMQIDETSING